MQEGSCCVDGKRSDGSCCLCDIGERVFNHFMDFRRSCDAQGIEPSDHDIDVAWVRAYASVRPDNAR